MNRKKHEQIIKILRLPNTANKIIDDYINLNIGNKHVVTPYYINGNYEKPIVRGKVLADVHFNYIKKKTKHRALIGKGNPQEIEKEVEKYAKRVGINLMILNPSQIKQYMQEWRIGIDCSGLVVWILNEYIKDLFGKPVWHYIHQVTNNPAKKLLFHVRSVENISVKVLSNLKNSIRINNIIDIHVGDMIIGWYEEHVLLITEIGLGTNNIPCYFIYVNSTWWYGENNGVVKGRVDIVDPKGYLLEQSWDDFQDDKNWTYESVKHEGKIMRLKVLNSIRP